MVQGQKRSFNEGKRHFKKSKKQKTSIASAGSNEEVLLHDVRSLLQSLQVKDKTAGNTEAAATETAAATTLPELFTEVDLTISHLSSTGDGLGARDNHVYVVPFTAPGDNVTARVYKRFEEEAYSLTDYVRLNTGSTNRAPDPPPCPYFTQCSGCQFQHLPYAYQLAHKRTIVEKAYRNFSNLPAEVVPAVRETCGSPLQYGYRTKLTPHFEGPPHGRRDKRHGAKVTWPGVPPIGFMKKGSRHTMDIEDCMIGTEVVRKGMKRERERVGKEIDNYQRGATLLLRESTARVAKDDKTAEAGSDEVIEDRGSHLHRKICITDHKATSTEYIDDFRLDNPAGAFFQNNNSILPLVTQYIRDEILGSAATSADGTSPIKNMIDAYCGSGFFTITLSAMFQRSIGIDVSSQSIDFARTNASLNNLPQNSTDFLAADANALFASIDTAKFPADETVVIIDPPRKGCDEGFIRQLLQYGPKRICYVSCNVHTQARDVGWLVAGLPGSDSEARTARYDIESLRGFDFFPQTSHVEGVAILSRRDMQANDNGGNQPTAPEVSKDAD